MKRKAMAIAFAATVASTTPSLPDARGDAMDGSQIARQAQKCWALLDRERASGFSAAFDARVDHLGLLEFRMTAYAPENRNGRFMAEAAKRTLQKCSPFKGINPGLYRFEMTYEDPFSPASHQAGSSRAPHP